MATPGKSKKRPPRELGIRGDRVRKARVEKEWTQFQLAVHSKISAAHISTIENGGKEVNSLSLRILAVSLGVSADYLLGLSD
jgi:transcriptional regulator with XRE-family HTH domain